MVRSVIPFPTAQSPNEDVEAQRFVDDMLRQETPSAETPPATECDPRARAELEAVWDAVGMLDVQDFAEPSARVTGRRSVWFVGAGIAAAIALGLAIFIAQRPDVYESRVGERRPVTLADGSRVTLNTGSRIEVRGRRVVLSRGEALFEVAHLSHAEPFDVVTDRASIRVTGTQFNVRLNQGRTGVDLLEGHVRVSARGGEVRLNAGQAVIVGQDGQLGPVQAANPKGVSDWLQGRVSFDRTPLNVAVAEMNRYSAVKLRLEGQSLEKLPVSGVFEAGDVVAFARSAGILYGLNVTQKGDTVFLRAEL